MPHYFVHRIDPVLMTVGGVHLWWYGLSYAVGFLFLYRHLQGARHRLGLTGAQACTLTLLIAVGVLVGGRAVEVSFDEWPFYREHPALIPALWLGGMATHGLLLGAASGLLLFAWLCRWHGPAESSPRSSRLKCLQCRRRPGRHFLQSASQVPPDLSMLRRARSVRRLPFLRRRRRRR